MTSITDEKYVSFTTFRRNGAPVASPVWIADLGDGTVGFTTQVDSGKVKRLGIDTQVEMRACDARGRVADDATTYLGSGTVVEGEALAKVEGAIGAKYGVQFRLLDLWNKVRGQADKRRGIVVTVDATA